MPDESGKLTSADISLYGRRYSGPLPNLPGDRQPHSNISVADQRSIVHVTD